MGIILDTSILVSAEKGNFQLDAWLQKQTEPLGIAAVSAAELWHGVLRATEEHRVRRERFASTILSVLPVFPYTTNTALEHARIWAELAQSGRMIGHYDLIIGATAMEQGWKVATLNEKHFAQIRGLNLAQLP